MLLRKGGAKDPPRSECRRDCQLSGRDGQGLRLVSKEYSRYEVIGSGNQKHRGVEVSPGHHVNLGEVDGGC